MRIRLALALLAIPLLLTGCTFQTGSSELPIPSDGELGDVKVGYVELPDGRSVLCVSEQRGYSGGLVSEQRGYSGGLSCDWDGAE